MATSVIRLAVAALVALCLGLSPSIARANCDDADQQGEKKQAFRVEERNGEKVYVIDDAIAVCGKVPRPSVVYVLQARSINYEWETLKQDFLPKIGDAVERKPF